MHFCLTKNKIDRKIIVDYNKGVLFVENGRLKILCDLIPTGDIQRDKIIIPKILELTKSQHEKNVNDMKRLVDYYFNKTNILLKEKTQQSSINNKVAIDYPQIAVTTINAYCFANPLSFSSRNPAKESQMKAFNDAIDDDNYSEKAMKMYFNAGTTGLGYRYIMPASAEQIENNIYFESNCDLDPQKTYCVYSNDLKQEKICAISYYEKKFYDETLRTKQTATIYNVWTKYHKWEFYKKSGAWVNATYTTIDADNNIQILEAYPLPYRRIPVVENLRKVDRTGDYELALDLIDAINALASSRIDDVEQAVDYVILLRDIDTESEGALERVKDAIKQGILSFKSIQGATVQPEIKVLDTKLNQAEVQTLQDFLCAKLEEVLNIPNRETRSSGGDTGSAVESRNGFRSLENIAGIVTNNAKKTENESLDVILAICKNIPSCPFKDLLPRDIEIKENRNRVENMNSASTSYATLIGAGMNDEDALIATRIVPDPASTAKKNKIAREEKDKREMAKQKLTKQSQNNIGSDSKNADE